MDSIPVYLKNQQQALFGPVSNRPHTWDEPLLTCVVCSLQYAANFLADSYKMTLSLRFTPAEMAIGALYSAVKETKAVVRSHLLGQFCLVPFLCTANGFSARVVRFGVVPGEAPIIWYVCYVCKMSGTRHAACQTASAHAYDYMQHGAYVCLQSL